MRTTLILLLFFLNANAEEKYWVSFRDKANVTFDPYTYFDQHAIANRIQQKIPLNDSSDYPVSDVYLGQVTSIADSVSWPSRWLNGIAVYCNENEIEIIRQLTFVKEVFRIQSQPVLASFSARKEKVMKIEQQKLLAYQYDRMQGKEFADHSFDGKGIRVAVFDAGFPGVDKRPEFEHLRKGNQIIKTYDFVCKKENVYANHWHGTATLSCIAGKKDSMNIGLAIGAEFLLARTERAYSEKFSEEENWLAAAEWADKNGANIISSSLGYINQRYFNYQMDGHFSLVSRAATMAASKGILVVNAAGNEGSKDWHYIDTPGDADSVLTVGGTDPETDMHIYFSSYGPAADGKLKPNVSSPGEVMAATSSGMKKVYGTSFSTPLVAGFAACAWQSHRQWTNMELFDEIEKASHLYPYYDYAHGFGIPQASKIVEEKKEIEPTFDFVIINDVVKVILREKFSYTSTEQALGYEVRRNIYYKVEDKNNNIKKYFVLLADQKEALIFSATDFLAGDVITVHFEGYTSSFDIPELNMEEEH